MKVKLPEYGTIRIRRKFAFFSHEIAGYKIWLEYYWVKERYHSGDWYVQEHSLTEIKEDPEVIRAKNFKAIEEFLGVKDEV